MMHGMTKSAGFRVAVSTLLIALAAPVSAARGDEVKQDAGSIPEAIRGGTPVLNLRYRFENVLDDVPAVALKDAFASTIRTAVGFRTLGYRGVRGYVELENITAVGADLYNNLGAGSLSNGVTDRPVVADPRLSAASQAYVTVTAIPKTTLLAGRSELALHDQRFVGPVAWRQHHQSFDAATIAFSPAPDVTLGYAFVWQVNRIFGDSKPMKTHLLHATHRPGTTGVTVFYYLLDYDRAADASSSTRTIGMRVDGAPKLDDWTVLYDLAYAKEQDAGDNPAELDVDYYRVELGAAHAKGPSVFGGIEVLGADSDGDGRFQTPLATLHKFNGFADRFLSTPTGGLRDVYVTVGEKEGAFNASASFHWFSADEGDAEYGTEVDGLLTWRAAWGQVFGFKGAYYRADDFSADVSKVALWTEFAVK